MLAGAFAVFHNATVQHKGGVFQRLVVNEPVQLGAVKAVVSHFIFNGGVKIVLPSVKSSSTQPVSILNSQEMIWLIMKTSAL